MLKQIGLKWFLYKVFFLIQLNCVVVYLMVLSLGLSFSFSIHNLSLMSFLTIQYLTCCTQVYKPCNANDLASSILSVEKCVSDIKTWMLSNKLQMNEDKTEVLLVTPKRVENLNHFLSL